MDSGLTAMTERVQQEGAVLYRLREEIWRVIVGQRYLIDRLLIGMLANGQVLLEGVPTLVGARHVPVNEQLEVHTGP